MIRFAHRDNVAFLRILQETPHTDAEGLRVMNRRSFLTRLAAAASSSLLPTASPSHDAAVGPQPTSMGITIYSFQFRHFKDTLELIDYCNSLGAGGAQAELSSLEPDYVKRVRQRAEELGMYLEVVADLPKEGSDTFERTVRAAKEASAICLRTACLGGRRYENFSSLEQWERFAADSQARIARAVPMLEKYRMCMGIENHKDWTTDEMIGLMKRYTSEYLGICLDTGNNLALLDDPMEVVQSLAPYTMNTHMKDMAVEEYPDGFLLAEVPMGEGILDMKRIADTISRARPKAKFTLEMITRNPLKIPCETPKYWATFPERKSTHLGHALSWVRAHKSAQPLPRLDNLTEAARLRWEEENIRTCLAYARARLGLG